MSQHKPTENDGLRKDGEPDKRVGTGQFAYGKVDPSEAGHEGGKTGGQAGGQSSGGGGDSSGTQGEAHQGGEGLRKDGQPDMRLKQNRDDLADE